MCLWFFFINRKSFTEIVISCINVKFVKQCEFFLSKISHLQPCSPTDTPAQNKNGVEFFSI